LIYVKEVAFIAAFFIFNTNEFYEPG